MARALLEIRSLARVHSRSALRTLKQIMHQKTAPASARVAAATELLDRAWGRPDQHVEITAKIADSMSDAELNAELERIGKLIELKAEPALLEDKSNGLTSRSPDDATD